MTDTKCRHLGVELEHKSSFSSLKDTAPLTIFFQSDPITTVYRVLSLSLRGFGWIPIISGPKPNYATDHSILTAYCNSMARTGNSQKQEQDWFAPHCTWKQLPKQHVMPNNYASEQPIILCNSRLQLRLFLIISFWKAFFPGKKYWQSLFGWNLTALYFHEHGSRRQLKGGELGEKWVWVK